MNTRVTTLIAVLSIPLAVAPASRAQSWKFGVMSDTQWGVPDDGRNPGSCAVDIVKILNRQFIAHGVKFVVAAGDLVDKLGDRKTGVTAESVLMRKTCVLLLRRNSITPASGSSHCAATTIATALLVSSSSASIRRPEAAP